MSDELLLQVLPLKAPKGTSEVSRLVGTHTRLLVIEPHNTRSSLYRGRSELLQESCELCFVWMVQSEDDVYKKYIITSFYLPPIQQTVLIKVWYYYVTRHLRRCVTLIS